MIATQRAGWTWYAHWRNFLIAHVGIAVFESALLAGLNTAYGTRAAPSEPVFVIVGSAALTVLIFGALFVSARNHGRQVLRSNGLHGGNFAWAWDGSELGGEHTWAWDEDELHMRNERGRADLSWTSVGAWLDAPEVLLLFPSGGRAFTLPERVLLRQAALTCRGGRGEAGKQERCFLTRSTICPRQWLGRRGVMIRS
jgi:hypothetical protein